VEEELNKGYLIKKEYGYSYYCKVFRVKLYLLLVVTIILLHYFHHFVQMVIILFGI
jgi:hypothetical protein